ncbi:periplasmic heavy metal sensor [Flavisphingomonas formosensis]|uniref:periplasmic heavy metal sensor n=1 Tax=Flavisphingomonas formosensis TaxID=861534 RepID=UPI0012FACE8B|nr:periplasmic heavy metal sensor [Sphingomonas formosensis]
MIGGLLFAALAVPSPAAVAAPAPAPRVAAPGAAAAAPNRRSISLSPQGTEVVKQWAAQKDPELTMLIQQQRALGSQMQMVIGAPKIDLAKLEELMKKQEGLQSDIRQRRDARLLALVKALPEADRSIFLKGLQPPPPPSPAAPPIVPQSPAK